MSSVYGDKRKLLADLPDVSFGGRPVKVSDLFGQGLVVFDPHRQVGVEPGRVRLWRLRSNTEADVIEVNCNFEKPASVADTSMAVQGFAQFLVNGPSPASDQALGEPRLLWADTDPEDDASQYDELGSGWNSALETPMRNTHEVLKYDRDDD